MGLRSSIRHVSINTPGRKTARMRCLLATLGLSALLTPFLHAKPTGLRCEYLDSPVGVDIARPRLSWQNDDTERNWTQKSYRILVASSPRQLKANAPDVWDSGIRISGDSVDLPYGGPALKPQTRYYWTVQVWDTNGNQENATTPAFWETGLLVPEAWGQARWIGRKTSEDQEAHSGIRWIWTPASDETQQHKERLVFSREFTPAKQVMEAAVYLAVKSDFTASLNGHALLPKNGWVEFDRQDVTQLLEKGANRLEVSVSNKNAKLVGFAGLIRLRYADNTTEFIPTEQSWKVRQANLTDQASALVLGPLSEPKLGGPTVPGDLPGAASLFRRDFIITKRIAQARLYVTALGAYQMRINGTKVGKDEFTPEFTNYRKRIIYQTYDVTPLLRRGENTIGAILGDGWFASGLGWNGERGYFQSGPVRMIAKLQLSYVDGTVEDIATDDSWRSAESPILHSEIYAGEVYDARREQQAWDSPGFDASAWEKALVFPAPAAQLSAAITQPPRCIERLNPRNVHRTSTGSFIYDMGQNMVGRARLKVRGPAGTRVQLRFAEQLTPEGDLLPTSARNANATDVYYLAGHGEEIFSPNFTFHGFRYVELTGYPGDTPPLDAISGEVISSAIHTTGRIETGNELVNSMYRLALWGQRGNFLSVPTDCPQRDERLGYTGDAQVFWRTGSYNADIAAFSRGFMQNMVDEQTAAGGFTNTAPGVPQRNLREGSPGWADAGIIIPWTAWGQYGDKGILERNWGAMTRFMDYLAGLSPDFIRRKGGTQLGDWLNVNSPTPADLIATGLWAMDADMMRQMAMALGKQAEASQYADLCQKIRAAFQKAYIRDDGTIGNGSQASYVLAFTAKAVPETLRTLAIDHLVKDIEAHNGHLTTGFLSSPFLLDVLSENGRADVAYQLLLNETCPSWGYMIRKGATTWWERWNADASTDAMNSYNHYAFGSVAAWIYRNVTGIAMEAPSSSFRHLQIKPLMDARIGHARGEYDSVYGKITTEWVLSSAKECSLTVTLPANTDGTVYLPDVPDTCICDENGALTTEPEGNFRKLKIGSGTWRLRMQPAKH